MWEKYVTRRLGVQIALAWNFGWGEAMKKVYGVCLNNTLVFRDAKKTDYYVDKQQHQAYIKGLYKLLAKPKFIKNFHKDAQKTLEQILKQSQSKMFGNLKKLTKAELVNLFQNFVLPSTEQFYIRMWTVFNIGEPLANVVTKELEKYLKHRDVTKYLLSLSSPLEPNDVLNERMDLLRLAISKSKLPGNIFNKNLDSHTARYRHIPMFDFDHTPYNKKDFLKELKGIKNPKKELGDLTRTFAGKKKDFLRIISKIKPNPASKKLFYFLKENVFLRDYRDMIRQKFNLELRKFYGEVAHRLGLSIGQVAGLTNQEIISCLKSGRKFPKTIAKSRAQAYLLIQKGNAITIYSGKSALKKAKTELKNQAVKEVSEIKGIIGSPGVARGRVKIIFTNKDLHKIKPGDVMVATMTRQDFVPAMRKAAALITDEGSVTAHAAIIARELKIPCIVAAKTATQILKDGNMVEVDGNKGVVKLLK